MFRIETVDCGELGGINSIEIIATTATAEPIATKIPLVMPVVEAPLSPRYLLAYNQTGSVGYLVAIIYSVSGGTLQVNSVIASLSLLPRGTFS